MKAEQLRKSILQYAIQGKLVPQIDTEEPASELLKKIKTEKQELIKQGKIKKEKSLPPITEEEKPFDIPESWEWVRFSDCAVLYTGNSINAQEKKKKYTNLNEGYNYIATKDIGFNTTIDYENGIKIPFDTNFRIAKIGSILLCIEGGSAGRKIGLLKENVCFGNKLCCFESIQISYLYLFYYLRTPTFTDNFKDNKSGMIGGVGVNTLKTLYLALPPLDEQLRIVARIEELMSIVDEYEKKEIELEKLEIEFPVKLKKSILQYAIQGKLVPQISTEESANELIKRIKSEQELLAKAGKIKKYKPLSVVNDYEQPFDIPESWIWVYLHQLLREAPSNGYSPQGVDYETSDRVLTLSATTSGVFDSTKYKYFVPDTEIKSNLRVNKGDILVQRSNSLDYVGVSCICPESLENYIYPDLMMKLCFIDKVDINYMHYLLSSPFIRQYFRENATGTSDTMKKINQSILLYAFVALPPLSEQQRIVERIEKLFALVNVLAEGKKLPKVTATTENKDNVIPFVTVEIDETKHRVDVSSFGMAARDSDSVKPETMEKVLEQVQAYYDKKN
ncbi:restriction endonuclease subunit S [Eubacterium sp. 1001713B170207_170306_E7]|uniref:restriction endonuclease subunit S n=1 Tax=Eubacterium sp. 1001713B170207_170306_E7 TaxID=2787097 RepID=UPI0018977CDC|nr:restriction endonuclease subunit S [Eubacterium sp. 1001713B170207_170306_E7]